MHLFNDLFNLYYRTPPVKFENKFVDAYPELYDRLVKAPPGINN